MARTSYAESRIPEGIESVPYLDSTTVVRDLLKRATEAQSGGVTGTGAAIEVALDFDPAVVILFNRTAPCAAMKLPGMATDNAMKIVTAGTVSFSASVCTLGVGKFTIGTDADVNTVAEEIEWLALGFSALDGD